MSNNKSNMDLIRRLVLEHHGIVKTGVLLGEGLSYKSLLTLVEKGQVIRAKSGYYTLPGAVFPEEEIVAEQFPDAVLTMETALYYQGYLRERPKVWKLSVSKNISKSRIRQNVIEVEPYFTEEHVLILGAEQIELGGQNMSIYGIERLICDVLKYRDKMTDEDYRTAIRAYIDDDLKDIPKLVEIARERRVLQKVENVLGTWMTIPTHKKQERPNRRRTTVDMAAPKDKNQKDTSPREAASDMAASQGKDQEQRISSDTKEAVSDLRDANTSAREGTEIAAGLPASEPVRIEKWNVPDLDKEEKNKKMAAFLRPSSNRDETEELIELIDQIEKEEKREEENAKANIIKEAETIKAPAGVNDEVAGIVFEILLSMELIEDMSGFGRLYELLLSNVVEGKAVTHDLIERFEDQNFVINLDRLSKIETLSGNPFMKQKWIRYVKRHPDMSFTWDEVTEKLSKFLYPVVMALVSGKPFLADWMPELGRFLD